jgi:hypothetical protein
VLQAFHPAVGLQPLPPVLTPQVKHSRTTKGIGAIEYVGILWVCGAQPAEARPIMRAMFMGLLLAGDGAQLL